MEITILIVVVGILALSIANTVISIRLSTDSLKKENVYVKLD